MRNPSRIPEVLKQVETIWASYPDMRLGQLLTNLSTIANKDIYQLEEKELSDAISEVEEWGWNVALIRTQNGS